MIPPAIGGPARSAAASVLEIAGANRRARRRFVDRLRILMYHGVVERHTEASSYGDLFVTAAAFARQMRHLARHYHVLPLEAALDALAAGTPLPPRAVALTIDDGYRNTIDVAAPILQRFEFPATVFVASELPGAGRLLWFDVLRILVAQARTPAARRTLASMLELPHGANRSAAAMHRSLLHAIRALPMLRFETLIAQLDILAYRQRLADRAPEFALADWSAWRRAIAHGRLAVGSHGECHEDFTQQAPDRRRSALARSKARIERELDRACDVLAYPYGAWDQTTADDAAAAGYRVAVTTDDGWNAAGQRPLTLHRTMIGDGGSLALFAARTSGAWRTWRADRALDAAPIESPVAVHATQP